MGLPASATKYLRGQTIAEFKESFLIIIRGLVVKRTKLTPKEDSFLLEIKILKVLHGNIKEMSLKAKEIHFWDNFRHVYEVGKEYTFLVIRKGKEYEVALPADGCPSLPSS